MSNPQRYEHHIGGQRVAPSDGAYFTSTNPATGEVLYEAARGNATDVARAVDAARAAFDDPRWRDLSQTRRGHLLRRLGDLVAEHADELARMETLDNGKLLREMRAQMAALPEYYHYYAGLADKIQGDVIPTSDRRVLNYTTREPLGVVGAITPWNSPLTLTTSKLAPALCAGNTIVIKPSEYTSATVLRLAELVDEAGFPPGAVNVVTGFGAEAGQALVDHPKLAKISFTGSTATGSRIAASTASRFIGSTLELGGKSPNIIFDDANVANAAMGVVAGIFAAAGQTCIAGSRVFAHKSIYDELLERVVARARSIKVGDPLQDATELGPLAFPDQRDKVAGYVELGVREGATVLTGGKASDGGLGGYFYEPTVLTDVDNSMRVVREEIFGPVAAVMPFETEEEVARLANDTEYGLAAGIWTANLSRAHRFAALLEAGTIWINTYRAMSPMSPRQGFKNSGVGVEHGQETIKEYTRLKSVWVNTSEEPVADPFIMRS
jgi:(Z)-2-((N-methylformamido)methylene)-5-hydroxybutyrolactone dehydrogenase